MVRRASLVELVLERLLDRIVSGEFEEDSVLPSEEVLAEQSGASRLTVREAVKILASQNVLRPVQGRGTFVNPIERWVSIEAIVRAHQGDAAHVIAQLIEVRSMIEVGAAELFAVRAHPEDLLALTEDVERMRGAHAEGDTEVFVAADVKFHERIAEGCGNPFVAVTFRPVVRALHDAQKRTAAKVVIRRHALSEHTKIVEALRGGNASVAGKAMHEHLLQTHRDAQNYLSRPPSSAS